MVLCDDILGEAADVTVVGVDLFVETLALNGDAVFRPLELRLQHDEIFTGFQVGIALRHGHQARQGGGEFALRRRKALERYRVEMISVNDDLRGFGTRLEDGGKRRLLVRGVALDGIHEIRDQVGTPLVLVLDLSPCALHVLIEPDHLVVSPREVGVYPKEYENDDGDPDKRLASDFGWLRCHVYSFCFVLFSLCLINQIHATNIGFLS